MSDDPIEKLTSLFERFPGIGPRQAQRFVQFLLRSSPFTRRELVELTQSLSSSIGQCSECMRYHSLAGQAGEKNVCTLCSDKKRDVKYLAVVASDADLAALEQSGTYTGRYFVLGGTLSLVSEKTNGLRIKQLLDSIPPRVKNGLKEIILAFPANPEGDATATRVREEISTADKNIRITALGRGLSTGSELEYADPDTIKNALEGRR